MNTKKYRKRNKKSSYIYDLGGIVSKGTAGIEGAMGVASAFMDNAKIADTEPMKKEIEASSKKNFNISSIDDAFNSWNTLPAYEDITHKDIRGSSVGKQLLNTGKGILAGAQSGSTIGGPIGGIIGGAVGLVGGVAGMITGNAKAKKEAEKINFLQDQGEARAKGNILTGLENVVDLQNLNYQLNYSKFGGPLHTKGGIFDSGLMFIDEGYTHEENPYGGIQISVDPEGNPNLVEEGEIVLKGNNGQQYVFSNSVYAKEDILKQFGLPKKYNNASFAYIADKISKEELETPNDPISRRSLDAKMNKLIYAQEMVKAKQNKNKNKVKSNIFDPGGPVLTPELTEKLDNELGLNKSIPDLLLDSFNIDNNTRFLAKHAPDKLLSRGLEELEKTGLTPKASAYTEDSNKFNATDLLRKAPILGSAYDMLFENREPDYTGADLVAKQAKRIENTPINAPVLSDYIAPKPFDRSFYINKLQGSHAATLKSLQNTAGNRGQAMAGILGADYNMTNQFGDLARQAEEYDREDALKVAEFNRNTNIQNINTALQNNNQRLQREELLGNLRAREAVMRDQAIANVGAARSNNRTNFFNNLGALGKENFIFEMLKSNPELLASLDKNGTISQVTKKKGGVLLTKNKKRKHA